MPLSKLRDRQRKQAERDKLRLEAEFTTVPVQPKPGKQPGTEPELDADGNPMPDYY